MIHQAACGGGGERPCRGSPFRRGRGVSNYEKSNTILHGMRFPLAAQFFPRCWKAREPIDLLSADSSSHLVMPSAKLFISGDNIYRQFIRCSRTFPWKKKKKSGMSKHKFEIVVLSYLSQVPSDENSKQQGKVH